MKKYLCALALLITTAAMPLTTDANDDFKYPIYVSHSGDDTVGSRVTFQIRNLIRTSPHLILSNELNEPHFGIHIVSMPADEQRTSQASIFSVAFTFNPGTARYEHRYLTSMVGHCGSERAATCAEGYVASLDDSITKFERYFGNDIPYLFKVDD